MDNVNRSPLGKYAQVVAAVVALSIIGAWLLALMFGTVLGITEDAQAALDRGATFALGAVFASAAVVNGVKEPIEAAHNRIDRIETATGIPTHGVYQTPSDPTHDGP